MLTRIDLTENNLANIVRPQDNASRLKNMLVLQALFALLVVFFWGIVAFFWQPGLLKPILFSSLLGSLAALIPSLIFAYLLRYLSGSTMGLVFNELIKILLTIILLAMFIVSYSAVNWLALLTSYVLVLKSYWLALIKV